MELKFTELHGTLSRRHILSFSMYCTCVNSLIFDRQPEFGKWAFNLPRGEECLSKWNKIPSDTDILLSHSPPLGYGDLACSGVRAGCVELLATVQERVKPKYHVFGHIHEGIFFCPRSYKR